MEKHDDKKNLKNLYSPSTKEVSFVEVPAMKFLMVDGKGDPNQAPMFHDAIATLYPIAYALKFAMKTLKELDYTVMPLEGLWWAENMADFEPEKGNRDHWQWTLMIKQPEEVTDEIFEKVAAETKSKKDLPLISILRLESFPEGTSAQLMHIGPFSTEGPNIARIHEFIDTKGYKLHGKHHEIYLSDMRKVDPIKMKTILRQPCIQ